MPSQPASPPRPGPLLAGPAPRPPASGRRRTRLRRTAYAIAAPLIGGIVRLLWATVRVGPVRGEEHLASVLDRGEPVVVCFWHEELIPNVTWLTRRFRARGRALAFMVSPSVDGDLVTRVLERSGGLVARGSATRSGVKALRDLYRLTRKRGASPVILPDGPQGPPHVMKEGALLLAQLAEAPILLITSRTSRCRRLATWDRLQVPMPFARVDFAVAEPVPPPAQGTAEELEAARADLEARLSELGSRLGDSR